MSRSSVGRTLTTAALLAAVAAPLAAGAQGIKINDSTTARVGLLAQGWADWTESVPDANDETTFSQNLFLRRIRLIASGNWGSKVNFFFETDNPNLGRGASNTLTSGLVVQDAYVELRPTGSPAFGIVAGLQVVPVSRNTLQSAATLLPIDYGAYSFAYSGPTGSSTGRDVGVMAKGNIIGQRLEYRLGVYDGVRDAEANNALRVAGRLQLNLLQPEAPTFFYPGTYFGTRPTLAVGVSTDMQSSYRSIAADAFFDHPVGANAGVTLQGNWVQYDGDDFIPAFAKQNTFVVEGGLHARSLKITPFVQVSGRSFDNDAGVNDTRFQIGAAYYLAGHNLNVKAGYTRINLDPPAGDSESQNALTIQLQGFFLY